MAGGPTTTGYLEFFPAGTAVRHGYIGFSDGSNINITAEVGKFNFVGTSPTISGNAIWNAGNFNPATKLDVSGGTITSNLTVNGNISAGGTLQTKTPGDATIILETTGVSGQYTRKNIISSVNVGGGSDWLFRSSRPSDGASEDFVLKSGKGGDILTTAHLTDLVFNKNTGATQQIYSPISFNTNYIDIVRGGVLRCRQIIDPSGNVIFQNGDSNDNYFYFNTAGAVWTKQFGDLNTRIENRINNKSFRFAYAGDLYSDWNRDANNFQEPYWGAAMTVVNFISSGAAGDHIGGARWRYAQMSDSGGNWYSCSYA